MKAVVMKQYGGTEVLEVAEVAKPSPTGAQLLVDVKATALNPVDHKIREGMLKELFEVNFPRILGGDIAGVVVEVGPEAKDFKVGDEVFFAIPLDEDGGFAEYAVVDESIVASKPKSLNFVDSASLPVIALTAIQALRDFSKVKAGQNVLIHGGAGGVGAIAVQYAKHLGATVYATASARDKELVLSHGAHRVIDYRNENFEDVAKEIGGFDAVIETVGGDNYIRSIRAVKEHGFVPCIVNPPELAVAELSAKKHVTADFLLLRGDRADLNEIATLVDQGLLKPNVFKTFSLDETRIANEFLEAGSARGKVVLEQ